MTPSIGARSTSGAILVSRMTSRRRLRPSSSVSASADLGLRYRAALRKRPQPREPPFRDRDQLLDLPRALGDRGAVGRRNGVLDHREHVALGDRLPEPRQSLLGRGHAPAVDALDEAAAIRVRDHPADENDRLRHRLRLRDDGAHVENALHRLRHEQLTARQPPRRVAGRGQRLGFAAMIVTLVGMRRALNEGKREQQDRRHAPAPASPKHETEDHADQQHRACESRMILAGVPQCRPRSPGPRHRIRCPVGRGPVRKHEGADQEVIARGRVDVEDELDGATAAKALRRQCESVVGGRLRRNGLAVDRYCDLRVGDGRIVLEPVEIDREPLAVEDGNELVGLRFGNEPRQAARSRGGGRSVIMVGVAMGVGGENAARGQQPKAHEAKAHGQ